MIIKKDNYRKSSTYIFIAAFLMLINMVLNYFISNHIFSFRQDITIPLFFLGFTLLIAFFIRKQYAWVKFFLIINILWFPFIFTLYTLTANQRLYEVILISGITILLIYSLIIVFKKPRFITP